MRKECWIIFGSMLVATIAAFLCGVTLARSGVGVLTLAQLALWCVNFFIVWANLKRLSSGA